MIVNLGWIGMDGARDGANMELQVKSHNWHARVTDCGNEKAYR